jgi:hypothetical protein
VAGAGGGGDGGGGGGGGMARLAGALCAGADVLWRRRGSDAFEGAKARVMCTQYCFVVSMRTTSDDVSRRLCAGSNQLCGSIAVSGTRRLYSEKRARPATCWLEKLAKKPCPEARAPIAPLNSRATIQDFIQHFSVRRYSHAA